MTNRDLQLERPRLSYRSSAGLLSCVLLISMADAGGPSSDYSLRPVPFTDVEIVGGFWGPRIETNRRVTIPSNFRKCEETGRLRNFAKAGGRIEGGFEGIFFNDSDVFKVIEGASYALAQKHDPELDAQLDALIVAQRNAQPPANAVHRVHAQTRFATQEKPELVA